MKRLWQLSRLVWQGVRDFGRPEHEHIQKLRQNADKWMKASQEEVQQLQEQQKNFVATALDGYKTALATALEQRTPISEVKEPALQNAGLSELAKLVERYKANVNREEVMQLVAKGKPVPEIIETVLKRAAQESGASESAVWERVRKALDKDSEATPKASSTVNSDGKESQIK